MKVSKPTALCRVCCRDGPETVYQQCTCVMCGMDLGMPSSMPPSGLCSGTGRRRKDVFVLGRSTTWRRDNIAVVSLYLRKGGRQCGRVSPAGVLDLGPPWFESRGKYLTSELPCPLFYTAPIISHKPTAFLFLCASRRGVSVVVGLRTFGLVLPFNICGIKVGKSEKQRYLHNGSV